MHACPRCGAPQDAAQPDPLARCSWCGALLANSDLPPVPLLARPRLDAYEASRAVWRALREGSGSWQGRGAELVYYPFAIVPSARRPYRPLSALPPLVIEGWKPSGADVVRDVAEEASGVRAGSGRRSEEDAGTRVPVSLPMPEGAASVHYPFFRVVMKSGRDETAAFVDGVDGQVILPPELVEDTGALGHARRKVWAFGTFAAGALLGVVVPFPFSLPLFAAAGFFAWRGLVPWPGARA